MHGIYRILRFRLETGISLMIECVAACFGCMAVGHLGYHGDEGMLAGSVLCIAMLFTSTNHSFQ